jgi:hypothetical protein
MDGESVISSTSERFGELHFLVFENGVGSQVAEARILVNRLHSFEFFVEPPLLEATSQTYTELTSSFGEIPLIEARDPDVDPRLIDLSEFYNALLDTDWHRQVRGNDLTRLPRGSQEFGGVQFDVRGVVQVAGSELPGARFPRKVEGIPVRQKCQRVHFLHASGWQEAEGTEIGQYLLHYEDGQTAVISLVYGQNISDWWFYPNNPTRLPEADVVWRGVNGASLSSGQAIRLYKYTWQNHHPDSEIIQLDLMSTMSSSAPYLIAITTE